MLLYYRCFITGKSDISNLESIRPSHSEPFKIFSALSHIILTPWISILMGLNLELLACLLFRKGSFRAGAKRRFEHCPSVRSLVRQLMSREMKPVTCPLVYNLGVWSSCAISNVHSCLNCPQLTLTYLAVQSEKGMVGHSLWETSCPPRTVH